jgi:Domain of unknown function (DUF4328)
MAQQAGQVSPDGKWLWNGAEWVPNVPAVTQGPSAVPWARPYESARFRAMFVTIFIAVNIVGLLLLAIVDLLLPGRESQASAVDQTRVIVVGLLALVVVIVYIGSLIPAIVFFCMWVHRVVRNMPALGAFDPRWSPAGAVGRCFIPFLNLAHPMSGTLEAWRGSDPSLRWIDVGTRRRIRPPLFIIGWWSLWLIGNWVSGIGTRIGTSTDPAAQAPSVFITVAGTVLVMGAGALAIVTVRQVTARQDRKNELIASGQLA